MTPESSIDHFAHMTREGLSDITHSWCRPNLGILLSLCEGKPPEDSLKVDRKCAYLVLYNYYPGNMIHGPFTFAVTAIIIIPNLMTDDVKLGFYDVIGFTYIALKSVFVMISIT